MSDTDTEPTIIHEGKPVTAAEYMREHVEPVALKPQHVERVQNSIARKHVTYVVGRTGPKSLYHAIRRTQVFDATGKMIGHDGTTGKAVCRSDCTIVLEMVSFDGCCDSIPDARQCAKCLARLNGEVV